MLSKKYRLSYLPLFYEDLDEKIPYHSLRERKYTYYRIYVDNYTIYYVVINDDPNNPVMEVRRFLYNGQDRNELV